MNNSIDSRNRKIWIHTIFLGLFSFLFLLYSVNHIFEYNRNLQRNINYETICDTDCTNKKLSLIVENALQPTQKK
jgi:hypothetical protein